MKFKIREACALVKKSINDLNRILTQLIQNTGDQIKAFLVRQS